jgi:hypothetical protein
VRFVPEARVYYRASGAGGLSYIGRSKRKLETLWRSMQVHIRALRSLEESERVRAACLKYLQISLIYFHPERPDIVQEAEEIARDLGGRLEAPRLSWKYSWIKAMFGWGPAKHAWLVLPRIRWSFQRSWDKTLFRIENRKLVEDSGTGEIRLTLSGCRRARRFSLCRIDWASVPPAALTDRTGGPLTLKDGGADVRVLTYPSTLYRVLWGDPKICWARSAMGRVGGIANDAGVSEDN